MRITIYYLLLLTFFPALADNPIYIQYVLPNSHQLQQGYDSDEELSKQNCLQDGSVVIEGSRVIDQRNQNTNSNEAALQLNINTGIGPSIATFSNQPVRKFVSSFNNDAETQTFIYRTNVVLPSQRYIPASINNVNARGDLLIHEPQAFRDMCGNSFIKELYHQGSLYLTLQLHFINADDKRQFTLSNTINAQTLVEQLPAALKMLNTHGEIELRVFQLGGNASEIEKFFTISRCDFSHASACIEQFAHLLDYQENFLSQFPSTHEKPIPATAGINELINASYAWLNIPYTPAPDKLTPQIKGLRNTLFANLWPLYAEQNRAQYLLRLTNLDAGYQRQVENLLHDIYYNQKLYRTAGQVCFVDLDRCVIVYNQLTSHLKPLDTKLLATPIFKH